MALAVLSLARSNPSLAVPVLLMIFVNTLDSRLCRLFTRPGSAFPSDLGEVYRACFTTDQVVCLSVLSV